MVTIVDSIVINRSAAQVFSILTSSENRRKWQPTLIEDRTVPPESRQLGTQVYQVHNIFGARIESKYTVISLEPDRLYSIHSLPGNIPIYTAIYRFEALGNATRLTLNLTLDMNGFPLRGLLNPVIGMFVRRETSVILKLFKQVVEST